MLPGMVERQNTLYAKGKYRRAVSMVAEGPVNALDVAEMPLRKDYARDSDGEISFNLDYGRWLRAKISAGVMQQRCAAAYEKKVGLIQNWLELQGHMMRTLPWRRRVSPRWRVYASEPSATLLVVHSKVGRESIALARGMEVWVG
eukprot:7391337-Prymnesium_polylepis.1